jgi:hemoglobin
MSESSTSGETANPYDLLGGETGVRELVDRFYDLMQLEPVYAELRAMHPPSLDGARDKLFWFLSGWLGGPPLFEERFGHPRLRARHFPFAIGVAERDAWLSCMFRAMQELGIEPGLQRRLQTAFAGTADWMRNKSEPGVPQPGQ